MAISSSVAVAFAVISAVYGVRWKREGAVARSCGIGGPPSTKGREVNISIVNGEDAGECDFTWQVSFWRLNTVGSSYARPFCGGTLIDPNWILTAEYCIGWSKFEIVAGDWKASDISVKQQQRRSGTTFVHPKYNDNTLSHDFALVYVEDAFKITECVAPACLPEQDIVDDGECFTSGWGTLRSGGSQPDILQQTDVQFISQEKCQNAYGDEAQIDDSMLCAQGRRNGEPSDACQGDTGGPLVCKSNGGAWTLAGATSWGSGCADPRYPGVWAKVHTVLEWVQETIAKPPPKVRTECNCGSDLNPNWNNDGWCDCPECEDEVDHDCESCGCPSECGGTGFRC